MPSCLIIVFLLSSSLFKPKCLHFFSTKVLFNIFFLESESESFVSTAGFSYSTSSLFISGFSLWSTTSGWNKVFLSQSKRPFLVKMKPEYVLYRVVHAPLPCQIHRSPLNHVQTCSYHFNKIRFSMLQVDKSLLLVQRFTLPLVLWLSLTHLFGLKTLLQFNDQTWHAREVTLQPSVFSCSSLWSSVP